MTLERLLPADAIRPRWSSESFLVYAGSVVMLAATATLLAILGEDHGNAALVGYSAIALAAALGLALALERTGRDVAAGVLAFLAVVFFAAFVAALANLVGIVDVDADDDYQPGTLVLEAVTIAASFVALRRFRAPLLMLPIAVTFSIAVADLGSLSSWNDAEDTLLLLVGVVLIAAGVALDRAGLAPFAFWLHAVGGLAFGGAVLSLIDGDLGWVLVGLLSLAYVAAAYVVGRSSYAVLGSLGILATATYFIEDGLAYLPLAFVGEEPGEIGEPWEIALWYVGTGLFIFLLGLVGERVARVRRIEPEA